MIIMRLEDIRKSVAQRLKDLEKTHVSVEKELEESPEGSLHVRRTDCAVRYYWKKPGEKEIHYLSGKKEDVTRRLEDKAYLLQLKESLSDEIACCKKYLHQTEKIVSAESVYLNIEADRRHLIQPYGFGVSDKEVKRFMSFKNMSHVDKSNFKTLSGEKVRSKSELIISDRLKYHGIPYLYEPSIHLDDNGTIWNPDFYVLNKRTGEAFLWEHFGMLANEDYCNNFQYKLERYSEAGIFVGKQLIITTESTSHQLNTDYVDRLIEQYLK